MLKSTLTTWGDGVFESIRSIPRDWNEFHILWTTSVSVMVNLSSDRKQHSVSRVFSAATFPQWHESDGPWTHRPLRILDRAERDSPVTVAAVHVKAPQWIYDSKSLSVTFLWLRPRTGAVWPGSLWLSSPLVPLNPSTFGIQVVCVRKKHRQQEKERQAVREKCTFPFQEKQMRANNNKG